MDKDGDSELKGQLERAAREIDRHEPRPLPISALIDAAFRWQRTKTLLRSSGLAAAVLIGSVLFLTLRSQGRESLYSDATCGSLGEQNQGPSQVDVDLEISKGELVAGESLRLSVTVRNRRTSQITYGHGSVPFDFWIESPTGIVWRHTKWLESRRIFAPSTLDLVSLKPGQDETGSVVWRQDYCSGKGTVPPGDYTARALLDTVDPETGVHKAWWSKAVTLRVRPGASKP